MPKDTFFNLSESKKQRIFDAAVDEFSQRRFTEASINQIVKNSGISRGSFYQYFKNKEDLYLFVLKQIGKAKLDTISRIGELNSDADFFEGFMYMFRSVMEWRRTKPRYYKIGMLMETDDSHFITELRKTLPEGFDMIRDIIRRDMELGRIRPDIDPVLVVEILYTLNMYILLQYFKADSEDELEKKVSEIISILKHGIVNK